MNRLWSLPGSILALCAMLPPGQAHPQTPPAAEEKLEEVVIFARGENLIGVASAASEGAVGGADLSVRPLLRVAELLEAVPGLIAAQHSGSGKANQYFLRGFNLDHGTDFTTYIDDVPMNLRSQGHGQGYLDLNGLIPEVVDRIDYRKGPYRADVGDFALAGAAFMTTTDRIPQPFVAAEGGQYGWRRLAGGGSFGAGPGELTVAGQWKAYDGPWQLPEDLRHVSGYAKYAQPTPLGELRVSLSAYAAKWDPTEQIPERAIGTVACADQFCALDDSATGQTTRYVLSGRLQGDSWRATLYTQFYDWNMYSDPTYDYQIHQWDRRWIQGGRYEREFKPGETVEITTGVESRFDSVSKLQVDHTDQRQFVDYVSAHDARELSGALYTEATWHPAPAVRIMAGARGDWYSFEADATVPGFGSGSAHDSIVSPKVAVAWRLTDTIEAYGNWGRGFHSNDARGVAATDPAVPGLVRGTGREVGARFQRGPVTLSAAYWWLELGSELKFVGDSNSVEPGAGSRRRGYELVGFWRPASWLALDAVWTGSRARYVDSPGEDHIAGGIESAGEFGVSAVRGRWEASARLRFLGPYPLLEDNSQRAGAEKVINLRAAWKTAHWTLYGELLNVFNDDGKDIVYYYETFIPAIDTAPTEGRVSRAEEPRTVRLGVRYAF
jgi:hypothetical protein